MTTTTKYDDGIEIKMNTMADRVIDMQSACAGNGMYLEDMIAEQVNLEQVEITTRGRVLVNGERGDTGWHWLDGQDLAEVLDAIEEVG